MKLFLKKSSFRILFLLCTLVSVAGISQPTVTSITPSSGKPGDTIVIVGTGFAGTVALTEVYFGNARVTTYRSASTTTLRVIVPIGATYGAITVFDKLNKRYGTSKKFFSPTFSKPKGSFTSTDMTVTGAFATGTNPYNVAVGDIDGDAKPDAVVVNYGANTFSAFRNTSSVGAVSFDAKVDFATGANPYSVAIADINNDSKLDVIVVNNGASTVSVFQNTSTSGTVSFATKIDYATGASGSGSTGIAVADLDNDGWQDIIVANGGNNKVSFIKNNSTTTTIAFATKVEYTTGTTPRGIAIADIDGDSKFDIVTTNAGASSISIIRNTTVAGTFSVATKVDYAVGLDPYSVAAGDIDGDGKLDVIVSNYNATNISTLRNTSVSGTISLSSAANKTSSSFPETVGITDIDSDGKVDIMYANNSSSFSVLKNTTTTTTPNYATSVNFTTGSLTYAHAMGDIDGDGKIDAVVVTNLSNRIVVVRNTPAYSTNANLSALTTIAGTINPAFNASTTSYTASVPNATTSTTITATKQQDSATLQVQINGGIYTNLTSGVASSALPLNLGENTINIKVTAQDGTTIKTYTLTVTRIAPPTVTSISPTSGAIGTTVTLTGTFFNSTPANNIVYFGATKATVTAATTTSLTATVPTGATYAPITVLNTVSGLSGVCKDYFNTTFKPNKGTIDSMDMTVSANFGVNTYPSNVAVGDIDGDGKADAVVLDASNAKLSVLRNTSSIGVVSFASKVDFTTLSSTETVTLGDINNDGKLDVVVVNFLTDSVSIFRNTSSSGSISFATRLNIRCGLGIGSYRKCVIGDIDGDGKPEITLGTYSLGQYVISVLRNTSTSATNLSFAFFTTFVTGNNPIDLAIGDINGDGKADIVTANKNPANATGTAYYQISVLKNTSVSGSISFAAKQDFNVDGSPSYIALADINGDGINDIVTGNTSTTNVSVLINYSNASGIFMGTLQNFTTGVTANALAVADIDGDGRLDIAVSSYNKGVQVIRNITTVTYTMSFTAPITLAKAISLSSIVTGDIDGDGKADITGINTTALNDSLVVLRNMPILSSNNNLSGLVLYLSKSLNPVFDSLTTTYTSRAFNYESTTLITATKAQDSAKIELQVNGGSYSSLASGVLSSSIPLNVGNNIINVRVTAQNGSIKIYTINIYRACLAPSSTTNLAICPSQLPFTWNTLVFTKAESKGILLPTANDCDSLALLNLTIKANSTSLTTLSTCDSLLWNGTTYKNSGSYIYHTLNSVGCDSAATLNLTIKKSTSSWTDVVTCDSTLWNGVWYKQDGQYISHFTNSKGCDSIALLNLTITSKPNAGVISGNNSFCFIGGSTNLTSNGDAGGIWSSNNSARVNVTSAGKVTASMGGNYIVYYTVTNACGTSTASFNIKVNVPSSTTISVSACSSYTWNGNTYTTSGIYTKTGMTNSGGCDSTASLDLTIKQPTTSTTTISSCTSYTWGGTTYTTGGVYVKTGLKNKQNCDSTATLNLTITPIPNAGVISGNNSFCFIGGSTNLTSNGDAGGIWSSNNSARVNVTSAGKVTASMGGNYIVYYTVTNACGTSTASFNIKVNVPSSTTISVSACSSYTWNGNTYTTSGIYTKTGMTNSGGCDSTASLDLTIKNPSSSITNLSVCDSIIWNGVKYKTSGSYVIHKTNAVGCDSALTLNLIVKKATTSWTDIAACDSAIWNGTTYKTSGQYVYHTLNSIGCDSAATLNLTVKKSTSSWTDIVACDSAIWNGITYKTSGQYIFHTTNVAGCDSTATLNITLKKSTTSTTSLTVCDSAIWNGVTYKTNGVYTYKTLNAIGCDSTATLNLTVFNSISGNIIHPTKGGIKNVKIKLSGNIVDSAVTSSNYSFGCYTALSNGVIRPSKNNDIQKNNGISAIDVILVQNHILDKAKLNSPYKVIAADVNNNKSVTNIDIIFMKRLILGLDTTFAGNRLWAFVDSSYAFPDATNPFPYKDSISFSNLTATKINQTFVGVKIGDVNYDWNSNVAKTTSLNSVEFNYAKTIAQKIFQGFFKIPITATNFKDLTGLQYTLHFDNNKYEFVGIENNKLGFDYNAAKANQNGNISFLWSDPNADAKSFEDGSLMFELILKPKKLEYANDELELAINNSITEIEAWDKDFNQHNILLKAKQNTKQELSDFVVAPNPSNGNINVNIGLSNNQKITFELSSVYGKVLLQQSFDAVKGNNVYNINLNKNQKLASGIYFLKAITNENEMVKRILIK